LVTIAGLAVIAAAAGIGLYLVSHPSSEIAPTPDSGRVTNRSVGSESSPETGAMSEAALSKAMLTPTDLGAGWTASQADAPSDEAFCGQSLGHPGGGRATVTLVRTAPIIALKQQAFSGARGGATGALATVRASTRKCTTWQDTSENVTYSFTPLTGRPSIGEDSVEYRIKMTGNGVTLHLVQVYVVQQEVLSTLSYGTLNPLSDTNIVAAESLAAKGAQRLAKAS
jgi:hypothetical protein